MRNQRFAIALVLSQTLPLASALSFANFQQITSILIPVKCQLAYNDQIDDCTVTDFSDGCSERCQDGLNDAAADVVDGCSNVIVSANTLLGIIKNGGQIAALCPQKKSTTSTSASSTVSISTTRSIPLLTSSSVAEVSVTIPTSGGVQLSTTLAASTPPTFTTFPSTVTQATPTQVSTVLSTSSSSSATSSIDDSTSIESSIAVTSISQSNTITQSQAITSTTQDVTSTSSSATTSTSTSTSQGDSQQQASLNSGGGSPFDIAGAASDVRAESMLCMVVLAGWAFTLLGR